MGYSNTFQIRQLNFTATTATANSRHGMDTTFRGVMWDLPRTNEWCVKPFSLTIQRYDTAPQPYSDASRKRCNWTLMTALNPGGLKHLGTNIVLKLASSSSHPYHTMESASEISSSQPHFCLHRLCNCLLVGRIIGTMNPMGSYIELTKDKIPLPGGPFLHP